MNFEFSSGNGLANSSRSSARRQRISVDEVAFLGDGLAAGIEEDHEGHGQAQPRSRRRHERAEGDQDPPAHRHAAEGRIDEGQGRLRGQESDGLLRVLLPPRKAGSESGIFGNL